MIEENQKNLIDKLISRRSIRVFDDESVGDEKIKKLIEAAVNAPCGGGNQVWRFKIIRDREKIDLIKKQNSFEPDFIYIGNTKCLICVFIKHFPKSFNKNKNDPIDNPDYATGFAGVENLILAAHFMGLGACWYKANPKSDRKIKEIYGLDDGYKLIALVSVGGYNESEQPIDKPKREIPDYYII